MFDPNSIFSNPALDPGKVILYVFSILRARWITFLAISLLQALSLLGAVLVCSIIIGCFFFFVVIRSSDSDGEVASGVFIPLLLLIFASSIVVGWIWCIYAGAMMRAAVEICAGGAPCACPTVAIASKRGCKMVGFQLLFGLVICAGGLILRTVLANLLGSDDDDDDDFYPDSTSLFASLQLSSSSSSFWSSPGIIFLICLLYAILVYITSISMIGALPTIVVEDISSCTALRRSWNLCKSSLCLIFLSVASLNLLNTFIYFILWASIPANALRIYPLLSGVVLVFYLSIYPTSMITAMVLYLSLRIEFEGLTQSALSEQLSLTHPEPSAPPVADDDNEDDKKTPLLQAQLVTEIV